MLPTVFTGETFTTAVIFRSNYRLLKVQKQSGNSWIWFAKKRDHVQNYTKFLVKLRGKRKYCAKIGKKKILAAVKKCYQIQFIFAKIQIVLVPGGK